ncbi:MAG: hypothetical protein E6K87_08160 [Thaumarchaeota archaeon]|nr:MAG: hypothetical protein E6K87_08160 [Nitrososphaerota archaeon]
MSEDFAAKLETKPSEPVSALARLLVSDATRPREPLRDLNSEVFSAKPEDSPSEALKAVARPLT